MNAYVELRNKHQHEIGEFPMFFAFDSKQFEEGMVNFGLLPTDTDKVCGFGGTGGFILKSDSGKLIEMFARHAKEREAAIAADKKGNGYIYQMFLFELKNHEYGYTWELDDTLAALEFTLEDIEKSKPLKYGLEKAITKIKKTEGCFD